MAERTNGTLGKLLSWLLPMAVVYTALVLYIAAVSATANAAGRQADENHVDVKAIVEAVHRIEKRQVMIMTQLGVKETKR